MTVGPNLVYRPYRAYRDARRFVSGGRGYDRGAWDLASPIAGTPGTAISVEVLVNVVVPGQFDTGALARSQEVRAAAEGITAEAVRERHRASIPVGRFGRASELADVVTFL